MNIQKQIARVLYATTLAKLHMAQKELAASACEITGHTKRGYEDFALAMTVQKDVATAELDALDKILREPDEDIFDIIKKASEAPYFLPCRHRVENDRCGSTTCPHQGGPCDKRCTYAEE